MRGFEISPLYMHDIYKSINNKPEEKKKKKVSDGISSFYKEKIE